LPYKNKEKQKFFQKEWIKNKRQEIINLLGGKCISCGVSSNLEIDHIYPQKYKDGRHREYLKRKSDLDKQIQI